MARSQGIISYNCQTLLSISSEAQRSLQGTATDVLIGGSLAWVEDKSAVYKWISTQLLALVADKVLNGLNGGQWVIVQGGVDPVEVYTLADLPAAVAGVITLVNGRTYRINGYIDLGGARIQIGTGGALQGDGAAHLVTDNTTPMVSNTVNQACSVTGIHLENSGGPAFMWIGNGGSDQCVLRDCILDGVGQAAIIQGAAGDYINIRSCLFGGTTAGIEINGSWDSIVISDCRFIGTGKQIHMTQDAPSVILLMLVKGCEFWTIMGDTGVAQDHAGTTTEGQLTGNLFRNLGGTVKEGTVIALPWSGNGNVGLADF